MIVHVGCILISSARVSALFSHQYIMSKRPASTRGHSSASSAKRLKTTLGVERPGRPASDADGDGTSDQASTSFKSAKSDLKSSGNRRSKSEQTQTRVDKSLETSFSAHDRFLMDVSNLSQIADSMSLELQNAISASGTVEKVGKRKIVEDHLKLMERLRPKINAINSKFDLPTTHDFPVSIGLSASLKAEGNTAVLLMNSSDPILGELLSRILQRATSGASPNVLFDDKSL